MSEPIQVSDLSDRDLADAIACIVFRITSSMDIGLGGYDTRNLEHEIHEVVSFCKFNDCRNGLDQLASILLKGSAQPRQVVSYEY